MKRRSLLTLALLSTLAFPARTPAMSPDERRAYRDNLLKILPDVPDFNDWLKKTDELPPDFDALPRHNALPDPLTSLDGKPISTPQAWPARREEILQLFQEYVWGTLPPHPKFDHADAQETQSPGYRTRTVTLHLGPDAKGTMRVTLIIPEGKGPFPVLMGPGLIGGMMGFSAAPILRRGYITASYAGNDGNDDSKPLADLYPAADPGTLPRRGWAATAVLDYLETLPEVDPKKIAIFGYSRDGKQIMVAAALDPRIAAVLAGSTGVGGVLPFRLAGERNHAESIESTTKMFPDWFHPRLRFFAGREDRLPVDGNLLLALVAPRPCLMISGYNDEVANNWGDEQSLHSAQKVYTLLAAPDKLGILRLPGFHGANDMEAGLDFLDAHFGRSTHPWTNQYIFRWNFDDWRKTSGESFDPSALALRPQTLLSSQGRPITSPDQWPARAKEIRTTVTSLLGTAPPTLPPPPARGPRPGGPAPSGPNPGQAAPDVPAWIIQRSLAGTQEFGWFIEEANQTSSRPLTFGYNVRGTLYYPAATPPGTKLPTVVWLHSYSYPLGYMTVYRRDLHPILALVKAGYAVLAYDQSGFGSRMAESAPFYDRHPHWSQMGRLVDDCRAAVDALRNDSLVDPDRLYLFGYSLGGTVALHAAALDPAIKGVVAISGFTPMRTDTPDKGTNFLANLSIDRGLIPKLGLYLGHESAIPYDYDELIAAIAPRPVYIVQPQFDRDATPKDVHAAIDRARDVYTLLAAPDQLALDEPADYNRLPTDTQTRAITWMKDHMK